MALKLHGIEAALSTFRQVDRRFTAAAGKEIELGAKDIAELARNFSPVDRGDLVRSIRAMRVASTGSTRWRVKVGGTQGERDVTAYALLVHETFQITRGQPTRGRKRTNPGKRSREKALRLGVPVGGKFLARAFRELEGDIESRVRAALRRESNAIARSTKRRKKT